MNRTFYLKYLYVMIILCLLSILIILINQVFYGINYLFLLIIGFILLVPGRISQIVYKDLYLGRIFFDKKDFDRALDCFNTFENIIIQNKWKKYILWFTWPIYTLDVLAMVKLNISSVNMNLGNIVEAEKYAKEAIEIDNKYPLPYLNLALVSKSKNNDIEFITNIDKCKKLGMKNTIIDKTIFNMQSVYAKIQAVETIDNV